MSFWDSPDDQDDRESSPIRKSFFTAYLKGRNAAKGSRCPYDDHRTFHGAVTFARTWVKLWTAGRKDAVAGLPNRYHVETSAEEKHRKADGY